MNSVLPPGAILAGYRVERLIGKGGMGVVYLAADIRLERPVALKVLAHELASDPRTRERFILESRLAASVDHPNIVPIYGSGEADDLLWIAMRFVHGPDLRSLVNEHGALDARYSADVLEQVAEAIDAAHARNLIHRDVKPSNVLIESPRGVTVGSVGDRAYLTDFGLSRKASELSTVTSGARLLGTIDYIAPEQIEGGIVDGRVDQYGLAATLHTCLTGAPPFERDFELATLEAHLRRPPPRVTAQRPDLPISVDEVLAKGMAKDPADRYTSAMALLAAFKAALSGEGADATRPLSDNAQGAAHRHRHRRWILVLMASAFVIAAAAVLAPLTLTDHAAPPVPLPQIGISVLRMPLLGGTPTPLASGMVAIHSVAVSPDGRRVAFTTSDTTGAHHIYVKDIGDPGVGTLLARTVMNAHSPSWSPAGDRIAFVGDVDGVGHIYMIDVTGLHLEQLTKESARGDASPQWSPSGDLIAFTRDLGTEGHHVFTVRTHGRVAPTDLTGMGDDRTPAWSPDGTRLVVSRKEGEIYSLFVIPVSGAPAQRLTTSVHDDMSPDWSPDGTTIAFVRRFPANTEIYSVSVADGTRRDLSNSPTNEVQPRWSPDGAHIAFVREVGDRSHICVMSANGVGIRELTTGPARDLNPEWLDTSSIIYAHTPIV